MFFLLLFILFKIIYKIKNLFRLHPRSIFSLSNLIHIHLIVIYVI